MAALVMPRVSRLHGRQALLKLLQLACNRSQRCGLQVLLIAGEAGVPRTILGGRPCLGA